MFSNITRIIVITVAIALISTACNSAQDDAVYESYSTTPDWVEQLPSEDSPLRETYPTGDYRIDGIPVRFLPDSDTNVNTSWARIISEARMLLGEDVYQKVLTEEPFFLVVGYEPTLCVSWAIGCAGKGHIYIQEGQDIKLAMEIVPEPTGKDGVTKTERLTIFIHEFAHLAANMQSEEYTFKSSFYSAIDASELSPTTYGQRNRAEDYAESVTFFLLWPKHLKTFHPSRYRALEDTLPNVSHAQADYAMAASNVSRLTFGVDGAFAPSGYLPQKYLIDSKQVVFEEGSDPHENAQYVLKLIHKHKNAQQQPS